MSKKYQVKKKDSFSQKYKKVYSNFKPFWAFNWVYYNQLQIFKKNGIIKIGNK